MLIKYFITGTKARSKRTGIIGTIGIHAGCACILEYDKADRNGERSGVYNLGDLELYNTIGKQLTFDFMEE